MSSSIHATVASEQLADFLNQYGLGDLTSAGAVTGGMPVIGMSMFANAAGLAHAQATRNQMLRNQVAQASQRAQLFTRMLVREGVTDNASQQLFRAGMQVITDSPELSPFFGGSDIDMFYGVQNMVRSSRMRMGKTKLFGDSALSDQLAFDIYKKADAYFFEGGFNQLHRTSGYDRTQLAQITALLGQRGAFAGIEAGTATFDEKTGKYSITNNERAARQVTDAVEAITKPLRMLQDVVGPKQMAELVAIAEGLTGISVGVKGAHRKIEETLTKAGAVAAGFGVDARTYLNFQAGIAGGYTKLGLSGNMSAALAEVTAFSGQRSAMHSQDVAKSSSYHHPTVSAGDSAAGMIPRMAAAMQDPDMQAYIYGLTILQNGIGSSKDLASLAKLYEVQSPSASHLDVIRRRVNEMAGGSAEQQVLNMGGALKAAGTLNPENSRLLARTLDNTMNTRAVTTRLGANLRSQSAQIAKLIGSGSLKEAIDTQVWAASTLGSKTRDRIAEILEDGGTPAELSDALSDVLKEDRAGKLMSEDDRKSRVDSLVRQRASFAAVLGVTRRTQAVDKNLNQVSLADRLAMADQQDKSMDIYSLGMQPTYANGWGDLVRGVFGKESVGSNTVWYAAQLSRQRQALVNETSRDPAARAAALDAYNAAHGMVNGMGQLNLNLLRNGTDQQKALQREILQQINEDAGGAAKEKRQRLNTLLTGLGGDANQRGQAEMDLKQLMQGRYVAVSGKTGVYDYLSRAREEEDRTKLTKFGVNFGLYSALDSFGLLGADKDRVKADMKLASTVGLTDKNALMIDPSATQLRDLVGKIAKGGLTAEQTLSKEMLLSSAVGREKLLPEIAKARFAALKDWDQNKDQYEVDGKLTAAGKEKREYIRQLEALQNEAMGKSMTGRLTIDNFGAALIEYWEKTQEKAK